MSHTPENTPQAAQSIRMIDCKSMENGSHHSVFLIPSMVHGFPKKGLFLEATSMDFEKKGVFFVGKLCENSDVMAEWLGPWTLTNAATGEILRL